MLAASYWSLLAPAIEMAEDSQLYGPFVFVPISVGFAAGALFVHLADILLPMLVRSYNQITLLLLSFLHDYLYLYTCNVHVRVIQFHLSTCRIYSIISGIPQIYITVLTRVVLQKGF